jgi:hypothetical protein
VAKENMTKVRRQDAFEVKEGQQLEAWILLIGSHRFPSSFVHETPATAEYKHFIILGYQNATHIRLPDSP